MKRTPPSLATWMLEHCTVGDCNEALAGDLLQGHSAGLSNGWYWRQVLAACAVSWSKALRTRTSLLIFTLLWSMLAPAWKVFIDGIESAPVIDRILLPLGGFWIFPAFAGWLLLNSIFLWAGIFVYLLFISSFRVIIRRKMLWHPFLLASLIFLPIYGATFLWSNLYWYSFFPNARFAATPLGQIADLRMLADVMRMPFFIALLCALWNAIPRSMHRTQPLPVDSPPIESSTESDVLEYEWTWDSYNVKRFFFLMVGAGLINTMILAIPLCRLPELHLRTLSAVVLWATLYVVIGVLAGVIGSWLYWKSPSSLFREHPPIPFPLFALVCASGWIWIPSMVTFSEYSSSFAVVVAVVGTTFLTIGLRNATSSVFASFIPDSCGDVPEQPELFIESLYRAPGEPNGYVITLFLYAGVCAMVFRLHYAAAALLALSVFLLIWKQTVVPNDDLTRKDEYRRAALRLACLAIPAILVTAWACLDEAAHHNRNEEMIASVNGDSTNKDAPHKTRGKSKSARLVGYESLILWPVPEKKQIVPPLPENSLLATGTTRPLIIPFNGPYWYLQPPNKTPGPATHQSHGTPIGEDIASIDSTPLVMDAHQYLGTAILMARCREIQVEIENRDNRSGFIALAVLLTDSVSHEKTTVYLGQQPIVSTKPENFSYKSESVFETLRFPVPGNAKMRRFDEITVMMLPDVEHALEAPKIAIKQFQLFPH